MNYSDLIAGFFHEAVPNHPTTAAVHFETVSKCVFGTKQRRNGPMPAPEQQVAIRELLRGKTDVTFFIPWGACKQNPDAGFDVLDFCALKQLQDLQAELAVLNVTAHFHFRIDDCTDYYLFGSARDQQAAEYVTALLHLTDYLLHNARVNLESNHANRNEFHFEAARLTPIIFDVLAGEKPLADLHAEGWVGHLPAEQVAYYESCYRTFYPAFDARRVRWEIAKYFAANLARVQLAATCKPPHAITIAFNNPVPGVSPAAARLYYRSVPTRFTHYHHAPWIGKGYLCIDDATNDVYPKSVGANHTPLEFTPHTFIMNDVAIQCDYVVR